MAEGYGALKLRVVGVVQGVGFRPFIYRLARSFGLSGYVLNMGGSEVEIHVEGRGEAVKEFMRFLEVGKPLNAKILKIEVQEAEVEGYSGFEIRESKSVISARSIVPSDIAICVDCIREILDSQSRFYMYPWNSCVWCGPRFSMMYRTPYDRVNTSMGQFKFCSECLKDYGDSDNLRRFHGQGISCPVCGPKTFVYGVDGSRIEVEDPVGFAVKVILEGGIVALKGVGGYHIACLASRDDVVLELRDRKNRPSQPFALMARDYSVVLELAVPPPGARELLESLQRPIVVLPKKLDSKVSEFVAPGLSTIGVMLPYTGFQVLLLNRVPDGFLVMTSGNRHGKPMCTSFKEVLSELNGIVDYIIEHEREIAHRVDDSVIRFTDGVPVFLRRGRGYAPEWIEIGFEILEGLALGGEIQSVGAVGFEDKIVLTQFIGDLDEPTQLLDLERELKWLMKVYNVKPRFIAVDMHPLYHNRLLAKKLCGEYGVELIEVQHHHAHAVSSIAEMKADLSDRYIAVVIDGTGYGDDGGIWGGEILLTSIESYERIGSLKPFVLPGGDTAAMYPMKILVSLLASEGYSESEVMSLLEECKFIDYLPHGWMEAKITYTLAKRGRGVKTTSLGRTLDAISTLLRVCMKRTYEGEPAIKLEAIADKCLKPPIEIEFRILNVDGRWVMELRDLMDWVMESLEENSVEFIAKTTLHNIGRSLGNIVLKALKGRKNIKQKVVVSGGAAVNTYIVKGIKEVLKTQELEVFLQKKTPLGDGGIALGQTLIAACKVEKSGN